MIDLPADSNLRRLPGWGRGKTIEPVEMRPKWIGQFDTHGEWVATATARLTGAIGSVGQDVTPICVDALGRRCAVGADFARARDEGTFPIRYFFECELVTPVEIPATPDHSLSHQARLRLLRLRDEGDQQAADDSTWRALERRRLVTSLLGSDRGRFTYRLTRAGRAEADMTEQRNLKRIGR